MKKLIILSLSLAYCIYLASILAADLYSIPLNPLNSDYYYQKYLLLNKEGAVPAVGAPDTKPRGLSLNYLQSAIELEPTRAAYHMFYALALLKLKQQGLAKEGTVPVEGIPDTKPRGLSLNLNGPALNSIIKQELRRAVSLKPFSKQYREILDQYSPYLK